jgi:hypothetical protein
MPHKCTSPNCKHPDGPILPESEFYFRADGYRIKRCKRCVCSSVERYRLREEKQDVQEIIDDLNSMIAGRSKYLFSLVKDGKINDAQFNTILRNVWFGELL